VAAPPRAARERARLQVDERRTQLLELGLRLFTDRSYDELSIDDIARAAGISKGLLYHYFPSKRDYYVEVVRRAA
jgi:AcrR family transcriptional regulator